MTIKIRKGMHRTDDHATSVEGAHQVSFRAGSQRHKMLCAFYAYPDGFNSEEAATYASLLKSCYWKRASELLQDGLIEWTGETRPGEAGVPREVYRITAKGREVYRSMA